MALVSVIVPIYKAEDYIRRCVESILSQTFEDFELLLVDDGSPDNSGEICEQYTLKDSRVKVIHKQNGGVASARQEGLNHSTGTYTIHADPDDWVEKTWLEDLYSKSQEIENGADIVVCDYYFDTEKKSTIFSQKPEEETPQSFLDGMVRDKHLGALWNKLIKRSCYERYGIFFEKDLNYCEDFLVCVKLLLHSDIKLLYLDKPLYHYDQIVNKLAYTKTYSQKIHSYDCMLMEILKPMLTKPLYDARIYVVAYKEFNSKILTSKEFKTKYFSIKNILWKESPMKLKLFMYFSACGFMFILRPIYSLFQKIKN
ncbi:MAG: glycosyltransferase family 2 protein [Bacteroidales bacterium]|nr:glycosyltransferase family 2 protein [Bacteroidales bacterium]